MVRHTPLPGDVVRIRSARWRVARQTPYGDVTVIQVRGCDRQNQGERAYFLLPFEPCERLPFSPVPRVVSARRWRRAARAAIAASSPAYDALDSAVTADLDVLPYQLEPALAVTRGLGARLLIADDVGLGKTVQAGLVIAEILRRAPGDARAIVVCPAGLREQWQAELRDRFRLESAVLDSAAVAASAAAVHGANPWAAHQVVIASVDYLKRPEVMRAVEALIWDVAVFDEAHALSGRSDRRTAAGVLADRSRTVVMLSATPHSGDDDGFARLCATGALGTFPLLTFRRTRADVGLAVPRRTRWLRVRPTPAESRMHGALDGYARLVWRQGAAAPAGARLAMAVLIRRACSSAASLARSVARRLTLLAEGHTAGEQLGLRFPSREDDDDEPGAALEAPGLRDRARERDLLEQLLVLARDAAGGESKLLALARVLRRAQQPAIVFTEYRDTLAHLQAALASWAPATLHGGLAPSERQRVIRQFTSGSVSLLLATDAASEGLNLHQHCRLVVNLELPWTPLKLEQRVGRVERIGQHRRVHAIHLVAAGTAEETTVAVLWQRMERAGQILSALGRGNPDGTSILESIVEGERPPATPSSIAHPAPQRPTAPGLSEAAAAEAARILLCRRMATDVSNDSGRPAVALRRRGVRPARCCVAFRTVYAGSGSRPVWEALGGVEGLALGLPATKSAEEVRGWFTGAWNALSSVLPEADAPRRAAVEARIRRSLDLAIDRERAILAALADRRARMAATLLQPGLFDRRSEHAAAAQAAIVNEAVARCEARLSDLRAAYVLGVARCELVFALVLA
jgi:superfamily II DNA or RNA helicase